MFGFADLYEKQLFLQLISVSGVGASTARMMLSGLRPDEIVKAIVQGNTKQLEAIKGIGRKSAERLILELKDKLSKHTNENLSIGTTASNTIEQDALNALLSLGIARTAAEIAVKKSLKQTEEITLEDLIKTALKNL